MKFMARFAGNSSPVYSTPTQPYGQIFYLDSFYDVHKLTLKIFILELMDPYLDRNIIAPFKLSNLSVEEQRMMPRGRLEVYGNEMFDQINSQNFNWWAYDSNPVTHFLIALCYLRWSVLRRKSNAKANIQQNISFLLSSNSASFIDQNQTYTLIITYIVDCGLQKFLYRCFSVFFSSAIVAVVDFASVQK